MRFVLDNDVDVRCRNALTQLGHDAWTVGEAGRPDDNDEDQLFYAQTKRAVFVTHDRELVRSRQKMPFGRVLHMQCEEWNAPGLISDKLPDVLPILERYQNVFVRLSRQSTGECNMKIWFGTEGG